MSSIARRAAATTAAGVLAAALALPVVGGSGAGVVAAIDELDLRPEELTEPPPLPEKATAYDTKGHQIAQFYAQDRKVVPPARIADVMKTAIVAIEDDRFYEHGAIDIEGTARTLVKNLATGRTSQGGSSITQQYVKQVPHVLASDRALATEALVEPGTGEIKAMAASRPFGGSARKDEISYNAVADKAHRGLIGFQTGSTFKTFTLVTALKQGMKGHRLRRHRGARHLLPAHGLHQSRRP
ncbi:transglycosylase domain-containing protein [Nonomuraea sp. MTCD27]|uniref:transglycosylase domain-containing protein n=1 Tax=Nonomuraea sp. MTCD27 TaxID=1676747 RepID=UPI0035C01AA1